MAHSGLQARAGRPGRVAARGSGLRPPEGGPGPGPCRPNRALTFIFNLGVIPGDISRFSPQIDRIFSGKHLIHFKFLVLKMKNFRNFVLHNWTLVFDAEQDYIKLRVTNLKNKEVILNPKPQTLEIFRKH